MLRPTVLAVLGALLTSVVASPFEEVAKLELRAPDAWTDFKNNVVYGTQQGWTDPGTLYGRAIQLPDKSLLATSEVYTGIEPISLPIFRSTDGGATWKNHSRFTDKVNGWGMRYQPTLFVLPTDFGGFPAGTVLAAGASIPKDFAHAYIDVYASTNNAKTFNFVSHIAYGPGPETTKNGDKAIWEPFFMMYEGQLVCFYSDQRDPAHAQKLVHKTTKDLKSWSDDVVDVAVPYYEGRPGMTTVAYSPKSKKYVMTFENCGAPVGFCQVHYKVSDSPLTFDRKDWIQLVSTSGAAPWGSPYITWVLDPRKSDGSGLFIANGASDGAVFVNDDNLFQDSWTRIDVGVPGAYTRSLQIIKTKAGKTKLLIGSGGNFGQFPNNAMTVSIMDIPLP